jgi:predicted DNA-binding protein (MmcQ/YjbR family)
MKLEPLRNYLNSKKGTTEETPFGPEALVYKVCGKMYALIAHQNTPLHLTLKCDPETALFLRSQYDSVNPGYHMNKNHWNTLVLDGELDQKAIEAMIIDSYDLVVSKLTKKQKSILENL